MYLINKDRDNILSIVKSLRPIKYLYSRQNKDYDKHFHGFSLKDLIKQLKNQKKFNELLKPGESLDDNNNEKTIMDVNFKSTFNYIEELSNIKNLPISLLNKSVNKKNKKTNESNDVKRYLNIIRVKEHIKHRNLLKEKKNWDTDVTLDPGRYHPNYDYIKRRCPCAFLGRPKNKENFSINTKILEKNNNIEHNVKRNIKEINTVNVLGDGENNDIILKKKNKDKKTKKNNQSISNRTFHNKNFKILEPTKKLNFNKSNYQTMMSKKDKSKIFNSTFHPKDKITSTILKDQNTASSLTNTIDFETSKKLNDQLKSKDKNKSIYNYSKIHIYNAKKIGFALKKNKKELFKNSSMENLKCPILFDKMLGRDKHLNIFKGTKENSLTMYYPDYNIIRPHIPSIIFNSERKYQQYKKYMTGKIIRSYCYNPDEYFVLEYNENKEN